MKRILLPLLFIFISVGSFAQTNLDSGLVLYYPFNGNANDMSGNNNNPAYNNASLTADRMGNPNSAYHFNGRNNYLKVRNSPSLNTADEMSIALWVKVTKFYTGKCYNNMLLMKGDNDYREGNYFLRFADPYNGCNDKADSTKEMFYGTGNALAPTPIIKSNQWYSVVWVCNNKTVDLYVDSILRVSVPDSYISFSNRYDLFIGHMNNDQYPYWLNGDLDEIRIYNRALSREEILLYSNQKQNPAGSTGTVNPASGTNTSDYHNQKNSKAALSQ